MSSSLSRRTRLLGTGASALPLQTLEQPPGGWAQSVTRSVNQGMTCLVGRVPQGRVMPVLASALSGASGGQVGWAQMGWAADLGWGAEVCRPVVVVVAEGVEVGVEVSRHAARASVRFFSLLIWPDRLTTMVIALYRRLWRWWRGHVKVSHCVSVFRHVWLMTVRFREVAGQSLRDCSMPLASTLTCLPAYDFFSLPVTYLALVHMADPLTHECFASELLGRS